MSFDNDQTDILWVEEIIGNESSVKLNWAWIQPSASCSGNMRMIILISIYCVILF